MTCAYTYYCNQYDGDMETAQKIAEEMELLELNPSSEHDYEVYINNYVDDGNHDAYDSLNDR